MQTSIDNAIEIGVKTYQEYEYARLMTSIFKNVCQQLKEHIGRNCLPYSNTIATQWLSAHKDVDSPLKWKRKHVVAMAKALEVLDDIIQNGRVTNTLKPSLDRVPAYGRLPSWSRELLDEYLSSLQTVYQPNTIRLVSNHCSRLMLALDNGGIQQPSDITPQVIEEYFVTDARSSQAQHKGAQRCIIKFLIFAGLMESPPPKPLRTSREFLYSVSPSVDELEETVQAKFKAFSNNDKHALEASLEKYDEASASLLKILEENKYSADTMETADRILRKFKSFLRINSYPYSYALSLEWVSYIQSKMQNQNDYNKYRRIMLSVHEVMTTGDLTTRAFSSRAPKYLLHDWQTSLLDQYLAYRNQEQCAESTQKGIRYACSRFFSFLNREGIEAPKDITPELLYKFNLWDEHRTIAGKNLYSSQIRLFLRYLGEKGLVPNTLELAISYKFAQNENVVRTLTEDQVEAIYNYRDNAESPLDLRDSAILLLALRMGLRRSDIANLKFSDVSLKKRIIMIAQQKTGVALELPMPVDVGNSLYRYVRDGRPEQAACEQIFVRHSAPYTKLTAGGIGERIESAILEYNDTPIKGLHIMRKTFASSLLRAGTSVHIIAPALGHASFDNVDKYLSTDDTQLRKCAIGLDGIEYMGGYGL